MEMIVRHHMRRDVKTIGPNVSLPELERAFVEAGVSGFPVVDGEELVGVVSRSDVVRQLYLEHQAAEKSSDFFLDAAGFHEIPLVTFEQIADRVGERIEELRVKDVMSRDLVKAAPEQTLRAVAQTMYDRRVHRVLITDDNRLLGIFTALDLARLIADGRIDTSNG